MKLLLTGISIAIWAGLLIAGAAFSAETSTVSATVTAQNISVGVYDGTVAYGTLATSGTANTETLGQEQSAQNEGNATEYFNIRGQDTTNGTPVWTLESAIGTNQYTHEASTSDGSTWYLLTTSYVTFVTGKAVSSTEPFDLRITVPSSTTNFSQQDPDVIVQAVAS